MNENSEPQTIKLNLLTYNTHLFGDLPANFVLEWFGTSFPILFLDEERKQAIKGYLASYPADIVGLQEVWSGAYANNFKHNADDAFPSFYARNSHHDGPIVTWQFNRAGLCSMARPGIRFRQPGHYNFIANCGVKEPDQEDKAWSEQDYPDPYHWFYIPNYVTSKGFLFTLCELTHDFNAAIPPGETVQIGFFNTHFPTNGSKFPRSIENCILRLKDAINGFALLNPSAAVVVMGDFNISGTADSPPDSKYAKYFKDILLAPVANGGAGLTDAYNQVNPEIPGYSVNGNTNTLWKYFNEDKAGKLERPDYILYRSSDRVGAVAIDAVDAKVVDSDALKVTTSRHETFDTSDHYPILVTLGITFQQLPPEGICAGVGVATHDGYKQAFVIGEDGNLWCNSASSSSSWSWKNLARLPEVTIEQGIGCAMFQGSPRAYVLGSSGDVLVCAWSKKNDEWSWFSFPISQPGPKVAYGVGATVSGNGYAFVVGKDNNLWLLENDENSWTWHNLGQPPSTPIARGMGATCFKGSPRACVIGEDGSVHICYLDSKKHWVWFAAPKLESEAKTKVRALYGVGLAHTDEMGYVFVVGDDDNLWLLTVDSDSNWAWHNHGTPAPDTAIAGGVGAAVFQGSPRVYVIDRQGGNVWVHYQSDHQEKWLWMAQPAGEGIGMTTGVGVMTLDEKGYAFALGSGPSSAGNGMSLWLLYNEHGAWSWHDKGSGD
ncbi:MAG: endonuclease/exonuclease/phosphatase family protein [Verrucomicrobiales bacterium]|nr:endonuclease/exonuclease/phosphatase family protein [Verrucomicrobiales bacterium]